MRRRPRALGSSRCPAWRRPSARAIWDELNRVIALLHAIDYKAVGLEDFGKAGSYIERQVGRWTKQYLASETEKIEAMDNLIAWLPKNIPATDETTIVHGDYRLDNTVFHPTEPRLLAVLDWELSTLGDPLADFSYHCMSWHIPLDDVPRPRRAAACRARHSRPSASTSSAISSAPAARRVEPSVWDYYMAYNMFRLAAICQGIAKRIVDGTAASEHAREAGARARPLGRTGLGAGRKNSEKELGA